MWGRAVKKGRDRYISVLLGWVTSWLKAGGCKVDDGIAKSKRTGQKDTLDTTLKQTAVQTVKREEEEEGEGEGEGVCVCARANGA